MSSGCDVLKSVNLKVYIIIIIINYYNYILISTVSSISTVIISSNLNPKLAQVQQVAPKVYLGELITYVF